jgi:hypothetical protein
VVEPVCKEERGLTSDEKRKLRKAKAYVISLLGDFVRTSQAKQVKELGCKINMIPKGISAFHGVLWIGSICLVFETIRSIVFIFSLLLLLLSSSSSSSILRKDYYSSID